MGYLPQSVNFPLSERSEILNTGGLVAGFTGAVNDAVLLFTALGVITGATPAYITQTNDANLGTSVALLKSGVYSVKLYLQAAGANTVDYGMSLDVAAAGLNSDPSFAIAGFQDVQSLIGVAGTTAIPAEVSSTIVVSPEDEGGGGTILRFHATNGANAAPGAGSLTVAACYYRIRRINAAHV